MVLRHSSGPPHLPSLFEALQRRKVDYVLVGSVAVATYGVHVQGADLDIVPHRGHENLSHLIQALTDIEATPLGPFGDWTRLDNGEWKWTARPTSAEELAAWTPAAEDARTLDHQFVTRFGNLDVVPEVAGTFEELRPRATRRSWLGYDLWVAHVDDLLARATVPRRDKDRAWVNTLRDLQRELALPSEQG